MMTAIESSRRHLIWLVQRFNIERADEYGFSEWSQALAIS